ncbi:Winged helix-turn-helix [uncultured archaeon]|nr:Winged helix-turn-helix [uncultured archaeon]
MKMNKIEQPKSENKRGRLDIIIDILEVAKEGTSKTAIVSGANLNFQLTEKYLAVLLENGFLENRQDKYVITEKGRTILEKAKEITLQLQ